MLRLSTALLLLAASCAPSPRPPGEPRETITPRAGAALGEDYREGRITSVRPDVVKVGFDVDAPPARAWDALIQVVANLGVEVSEIDPTAFSLSNPDFEISRRLGEERLSRYLRCGSGITGPFADRYRIRMSFHSQITPTPDGKSIVETTIQAMGTNPEGTSNTRVSCTSTQILEARIAEGVARRSGRRSPTTGRPSSLKVERGRRPTSFF